MEQNEKKEIAAKIAAKYQFQSLNSWSEQKLRKKFKELYNDFVSLEINNAVLARQMKDIKANEERKIDGNKYKGYSKESNGIEKVLFILERNKRPMLTKEIEGELLLIDPELRQRWKDTLACVSNYVYRALKFGRIERLGKIGEYGFQYGVKRIA